MTIKPKDTAADSPSDDFENALQTLILESFASGERIQGTWEITSKSSIVPNWRITIEKTTNAELPGESTTFIDE